MRTYLRFLLLGSSIFLFQCSDHNDEVSLDIYFKYLNESQYHLSWGNNTLDLMPGDSVVFIERNFLTSDPNDLRSFSPKIINGVLILDSSLCDTLDIERVGVGEGPASIENYQLNTNGKVYEFTYRFTDADFDDAVPCEP